MTVQFVQWTIDVHDVDVMARFWSEALGHHIDEGDDGSAKLYPPVDAPADTPTMWLQERRPQERQEPQPPGSSPRRR